jgi:NADH:ubiquinone oxidoreductase subunit 6 (subunit J)
MNAIYTNASFQNIILTVLALVVIIVLLGSVYTFIRAIILFIFAHSKEENKKKAWNSIRFMIIGIILTIFLLLMVPIVLKWMRVPEYDTYKTNNIFNRVGELVRGAFNLGDIIKESQEQSEYRGQPYQNIRPSVEYPEPINSEYSL